MESLLQKQEESAHVQQPPASRVYKFLNWTATVIAFGAALAWLLQNYRNISIVVQAEGITIGGNLTLTQAKAIDFVSSAILAPLVLAGFNVVWFANARRFLAGNNGGVNLFTLVEASATSAGTYDVFKIWALLTGRSAVFSSFTALVIFSAVAKSALSNIVAYEAFMAPGVKTTANLRLLADQEVAGSIQTWQSTQGLPEIYHFNRQQTAMFASNVSSLLQTVAWQNASSKLVNRSYMAPNITSSALQSLDQTYMVLEDVPAVRADIECEPYTPTSLNATDLGDSSSWIVDGQSGTPFAAVIPGYASNFINIATGFEGSSYMGFSENVDEMFIGVLFPWGPSNVTFVTEVGDMTMGNVEGIVNGKQYTNQSQYWASFGMRCRLARQSGLAKLSRSSVDAEWKMSDSRWDEGITAQHSHLRNLQITLGASQYGFSRVPGITAALTSNARNFSEGDVGYTFEDPEFALEDFPIHFPDGLYWNTVADNVLWTTMETQRMAYEAAAMNESSATPEKFVTVSAAMDTQRYRITFVPALLSAGLLAVFLAAVQASALMIHANRSAGAKMPEMVDSLRLVMDALEGLKNDHAAVDAQGWSNSELEEWAKGKFVGYYDAYQEQDPRSTRLVLRSSGQ